MKLPFVKDKPWPEGAPPYSGFQAYPRYLYHHKFAPEGKIFKSPEETVGLKRKGWVDSADKFPKPSKLRPWWEKWEWLFKAVGILVTLLAGIVALLRAIR